MAMKQAMQPIVVQDMLHMHDRTAKPSPLYPNTPRVHSSQHLNALFPSIGPSIGPWALGLAKISALRHEQVLVGSYVFTPCPTKQSFHAQQGSLPGAVSFAALGA